MKLAYRTVLVLTLLAMGTGCHRESPAPVVPPLVSSWTEQTADRPLTGFNYVRFVTARTGWILGGSYQRPAGPVTNSVYVLLRTDNGGATWTSIDLAALRLGNGFRGLWPVTEQILYSTGVEKDTAPGAQYQFVYKSVDGGLTWNKLLSNGYRGGGLTFLSEQVGLSAQVNTIVKTTDGGVTWRPVWDGGLAGVGNIQFVTPTTGYASGGVFQDQINVGILLKTTDQGETWQDLHWTHGAINDIKFLTDAIGFITTTVTHGAGPTYRASTALYKTVDGGTSWQLLSDHVPDGYYAFLSEQEFFCAGDTIKHTRDGGNAWQPEYAIPKNTVHDNFESIQFPVPSIGYAVSHEGLIVKRILP